MKYKVIKVGSYRTFYQGDPKRRFVFMITMQIMVGRVLQLMQGHGRVVTQHSGRHIKLP